MLLIWDNFESVRSMPDPGGATPPLDEAGCAELREFLGVPRPGRSAVLITSRTPRTGSATSAGSRSAGWPGTRRPSTPDFLLAPYPRGRAAAGGRAFGELMEWLDGHPAEHAPDPAPPGCRRPGGAAGRAAGHYPAARRGRPERGRLHRWRPASPTPSPTSPSSQRLLPASALFRGIADADVLSTFRRGRFRTGSAGSAGRSGGKSWMRRPGSGCSPRSASGGFAGSIRRCPATSPPGGRPRTPGAITRSVKHARRPCAPRVRATCCG